MTYRESDMPCPAASRGASLHATSHVFQNCPPPLQASAPHPVSAPALLYRQLHPSPSNPGRLMFSELPPHRRRPSVNGLFRPISVFQNKRPVSDRHCFPSYLSEYIDDLYHAGQLAVHHYVPLSPRTVLHAPAQQVRENAPRLNPANLADISY